MSPGRFAERSGSLGVSPGRFAERSLRHPGFAHSCILAFALRAALDCKAGSFGPGSPLAYGLRTACSPLRGDLRPGQAGLGGWLRKRDGSSGAAGTSASPRPLRGPRTRPVPCGFRRPVRRRSGGLRPVRNLGFLTGRLSLRRPGWLRRREARRPVRRCAAICGRGGRGWAGCGGERDGSSGAAGTSASPRPLRGPRTRPACFCPPQERRPAAGQKPWLSDWSP